MKRKAIEALIEMGMPANTRGFKYIADIIEKYEEDEEWMYGKLTLLYEVVGKKDGVHYMNVERCIRHSFNDWVAGVISSIRKNGYYISTEKDEKWLGIRNESKEARHYETNQIKLFVEYAKGQGSKSADKYYLLFMKLINGKVGIQSGNRDELSQETLMELKSLETLVKMKIRKLMKEKVPYKKIYQEVKSMVEEF